MGKQRQKREKGGNKSKRGLGKRKSGKISGRGGRITLLHILPFANPHIATTFRPSPDKVILFLNLLS